MPSKQVSRRVKPEAQDSPPPEPNSKKRGRGIRTSTACEACKKRKTKCTGGPAPCKLCQNLGTECIIDMSLDMRRRSAIQRTIDETRTHQFVLNSLLETIRAENTEQVSNVLGSIRSFSSVEEATTALVENFRRDSVERLSEEQGAEISSGFSQASSVRRNDSEPREDTLIEEEENPQNAQHAYSFASSPNLSPRLISSRPPLPYGEGSAEVQGRSLSRWESASASKNLSQFSVGTKSSDMRMDSPPNVDEINHQRRSWHPSLLMPSANYNAQSRMYLQGQHADRGDWNMAGVPRHSTTSDSIGHVKILQYYPTAVATENGAQPQHFAKFLIPNHLLQPLLIYDNSSISKVYTDYLQAARQMLDSGMPPVELLGDLDSIVVDLFFRERQPADDYTCCSWASEVMRRFRGYDPYVGLACCLLLCSLMRWLLIPSEENYSRVPEMIRPTPSQRLVPHMAGIDTCPMCATPSRSRFPTLIFPRPAIRNALIHRLRDWITALMNANCSINWRLPMEAALETDPLTGQTRLTKDFEAHAANYDNWTVDTTILVEFPEITGLIRVVDRVDDTMKG